MQRPFTLFYCYISLCFSLVIEMVNTLPSALVTSTFIHSKSFVCFSDPAASVPDTVFADSK